MKKTNIKKLYLALACVLAIGGCAFAGTNLVAMAGEQQSNSAVELADTQNVNVTVKVSGDTSGTATLDKATYVSGDTAVLKWKGAVSGNNLVMPASISYDGKTTQLSTLVNVQNLQSANTEYKRLMKQAATMTEFDKVKNFLQTEQSFSLGKITKDTEVTIEFVKVAPVYRLYNKITSEHLFTTSKVEYDNYVALCKANKDFWIGEGIDWFAPTATSGTKLVHRLYNPSLGAMGRSSHYYTADTTEISKLTKSYGWKDDGTSYQFRSGGNAAIYTCYNELLGSAHHYTANKSEWEGLAKYGWDLEKSKNGSKGVFQCVMGASWAADSGSSFYLVEHQLQDASGSTYTTFATTAKSGKSGAKTAATALTLTGFKAGTFNQKTIASDSSTVVTIKYTRNTHNVTFDSNGHGSSLVQEVKFGTTLTKPTLIDDRYTVSGWYWDSACTKAFNFSTTMPDSDLTLYAAWDFDGWQVSFNTGDKADAPQTQTVKTGGTVTDPGALEATGYDFAGWYKDENFKEAWNFATDTVSADTVLYAKWTSRNDTPFKIEYYKYAYAADEHDADDECDLVATKNLFGATDSDAKDYVDIIDITGYQCITSVQDVTDTIAGDGSTVVKVYYDPYVYTITYELNEGEGKSLPKEYTYGRGLEKLSEPGRQGYIFDGWYKTPDFAEGTSITQIKTTDTGDITLYAKWIADTLSVNFLAGGGEAGSTTTPDGEMQAVDTPYGEDLVLGNCAFTRVGYTFAGWSGSNEKTYEDASTIPANDIVSVYEDENAGKTLTLTAQWTPITYTIVFDPGQSNDGTSMNAQEVDFDATEKLTKNTFARAGYAFTGWATTSAEDAAVVYTDEEEINNLASVQGTEITLYPVWEAQEVEYKIAYLLQSADVDKTDEYREVKDLPRDTKSGLTDDFTDVKVEELPAPAGYHLRDSVITQKTIEAQIDGQETVGTTVVEIYYDRDFYAINYEMDGGENDADAPDVYRYGQIVTADGTDTETTHVHVSTDPTKITKTGYTFQKWVVKDESGAESDFSATTEDELGDITLWAKWTANTDTPYTVKHWTEKVDSTDASNLENYELNSQETDKAGTTDTLTAAASKNITGFVAPVSVTQVNIDADGSAVVNIYYARQMLTVTLDTMSHGTLGNMEAVQTLKYGATFNGGNEITLTEDGYQFGGWYDNEALTGDKFDFATAITADKTLHAKWTASNTKYRVKHLGESLTTASTFDVNLYENGDYEELDGTFNEMTNATPRIFEGFTAPKTVEQVRITGDDSSPTVVEIHYTRNTYNINYELNGGTQADGQKTTFLYEEPISASDIKDVERSGYTFAGWCTDPAEPVTSKFTGLDSAPAKDITLYALWEANDYFVKFDGNGNTNIVGANDQLQRLTFDTPAYLNSNLFEKTGYKFAGWAASKADATDKKVKFVGKQEVLNLIANPQPDEQLELPTVTVYAIWTPITYTVHFERNGSTSGAVNDIVCTYDATGDNDALKKTYPSYDGDESDTAFKRAGYSHAVNGNDAQKRVFWNKATDGSDTNFYYADETINNLTTVDGDVVALFAQWTANDDTKYVVKHFKESMMAGPDGAIYNEVTDARQELTGTTDTLTEAVAYATDAEVTNGEKTVDFRGFSAPEFVEQKNINGDGTTVIEVKYSRNSYTVTFDANGHGDFSSTATVLCEGSVTAPSSTPTATGYVWDGKWYKDPDCKEAWDFDTDSMPYNDLTLYAGWTPDDNQYTVQHSFEQLDGNYQHDASHDEVVTQETVEGVTSKVKTDDLTKAENHVLTGTDITGFSAPVSFENKQVAADGTTIIVIKYTRNTYALHFDMNGHGTQIADVYAKYQAAPAQPSGYAAPTEAGWAFGGWFTDPDCTEGNEWTLGTSTFDEAKDYTIYAKWTPADATYKVKHMGNTLADPTDFSEELVTGLKDVEGTAFAKTAAEAQTIDGYTAVLPVVQQYIIPNKTDSGYDTTDGKQTVVVINYKRNTYKINYDLSGGALAQGESNPASYVYGSIVSTSDIKAVPSKAGYEFAGWFTDAAKETGFTGITATDKSDKTLYAKWTPLTYTVNFNHTTDDETEDATKTMSPQTITFDQATALTESNFTKTGYEFAGWATASGATEVTYADCEYVLNLVTPTEGGENAFDLYPVWTPITYSIHFDANGGTAKSGATSIDIENIAYSTTEKTTLTDVSESFLFEKTGYHIDTTKDALWATNPDGSGTTYANAAQITNNLSTIQGDVVTLYVIWTPDTNITYTVKHFKETTTAGKFNETPDYTLVMDGVKGGTVGEQTAAVALSDGDAAGDKTADLKGFYAEPNIAQKEVKADGSTVVNVYYYRNTYAFNYDNNGLGSYTAATTAKYGTTVTDITPAENETGYPTATGYTFDGWYKDQACTQQWVFESEPMPANDVTVYAKWTPATANYTVKHEIEDNAGGYTITNEGTKTIEGATVGSLTNVVALEDEDANKIADDFYTKYDKPISIEQKVVEADGSTVVIAKYNRKTFTLKFDMNGHGEKSTCPDMTSKWGKTLTDPSYTPTEDGYTFEGWYKDADCSDTREWNFATDVMPAKDTTIYAKWTVNKTSYKVEHQIQGLGDDASTYTTVYTDTTSFTNVDAFSQTAATAKSETDTVTGDDGNPFTFTGMTPVLPIEQKCVKADGSTTVVVKYNRKVYNINYELDGGALADGKSNPATYVYGSTVATGDITAVPAKAGYTFEKWVVKGTTGSESDFTGITPEQTGDLTLYAKWTPGTTTYVVAHYLENTSGVFNTSANLTTTENATVGSQTAATAITEKTKLDTTGFTAQSNIQQKTVEPNGATVVKVYYYRNTYKVTFDNNGVGDWTTDPVSVKYGCAVTVPTTVPTATGYQFDGWYKDQAGNTAWGDSETMPANDMTLYAKWTKNVQTADYKVRYFSTVTGNNFDQYETVSGATVGELTNAQPKWSVQIDTLDGPMIVILSSEGLEAPYSVQQQVVKSDGSTVVEIEFVAKTCTVKFDLNGHGTTPIADKSIKAFNTVGAVADPTDTSYEFAGWYTIADESGVEDGETTDDYKWDFSTDTVKGDTTLYAWWTPKSSETLQEGNAWYTVKTYTASADGLSYTLTSTEKKQGTIGAAISEASGSGALYTSGDTTIKEDGSSVLKLYMPAS